MLLRSSKKDNDKEDEFNASGLFSTIVELTLEIFEMLMSVRLLGYTSVSTFSGF